MIGSETQTALSPTAQSPLKSVQIENEFFFYGFIGAELVMLHVSASVFALAVVLAILVGMDDGQVCRRAPMHEIARDIRSVVTSIRH